jgi:hypothetical protein
MWHVLGLALGRPQETTALAIVEGVGTAYSVPVVMRDAELGVLRDVAWPLAGPPGSYQVRYLERLDAGSSYAAIAATVAACVDRLAEPLLAVDATLVGHPVIIALQQAGLAPAPVVLTTGGVASQQGAYWRVPLRDTLALVALRLQAGRLRIARALPLAPVLADELVRLPARPAPVASPVDDLAGRDGPHDDLVRAVAIACWLGEIALEVAQADGLAAAAGAEWEADEALAIGSNY